MALSESELQTRVRSVMDQAGAGLDQALAAPAVSAAEVAAMIDHTALKATADADQIRELCLQALSYRFGAVCVNSYWIPLCATLLAGSGVKVATTIGFPLGAVLTAVKADESKRSIAAGATELDMVINIGALKARQYDVVAADIAAVVQAARAANDPILVKVIIETCYLTDEEKVQACLLAQDAGAGFVKTSTGFGPAGATGADVALMRRTVGPHTGVKAAGGIRTAGDALAMIAAGANRLGTSGGVAIMNTLLAESER